MNIQSVMRGITLKLKLIYSLGLSAYEKGLAIVKQIAILWWYFTKCLTEYSFKITLMWMQLLYCNWRQTLKVMTIKTLTSIYKIYCNPVLTFTKCHTKMFVKVWSRCYWKTQTKIFSWFIGVWKMNLQLSNILHLWAGNSINVWQKVFQNDIDDVADSTQQPKTKS